MISQKLFSCNKTRMSYSLSLYFKYLIFLLIIILLYHFVGYPLISDFTSLSVNVSDGLPYGAIPGDYQTYYLMAIRILENPIYTNLSDHLKDSNYVAPLILSYTMKLTNCYESLLCYNFFVTLPVSAYTAFQLHAIALRFNIGEKKSFLLVCIVFLSPFSLITLTQVSKDLYSHLFYAVSIRTLFSIYDKNFSYSSFLTFVFGSTPILFIRPFQVILSLLAWLVIAVLLGVKDRKSGSLIRSGLVIIFLSTSYLLHSYYIKEHKEFVPMSPLPSPSILNSKLSSRDSTNSKLSSSDTPNSKLSSSDTPNSKLSSSDKTSEKITDLKHGAWDRIFADFLRRVNGYREYYIATNPNSPMATAKKDMFDSVNDLIYYLPKTVSMVILEPNPFRLIGAEQGYTPTSLRLLYLPWSFFNFFAFLIVLYKFKKSFSFDKILLQIYTLISLIPIAYVMPNYGNIARYSSFLVTLLLMILIFSKSATKLK